MKIPEHIQIFDTPVTLTLADQDRLAPHISGHNKLVETLLIGPSEEDVRKMVVLELMTKNRKPILYRLLNRLEKLQRARWEAKIAGIPS